MSSHAGITKAPGSYSKDDGVNGSRPIRFVKIDFAEKHEPATILVVDDEPMILEMRRLLLETLGYVALTSESGEKALEIFASTTVDAIILDYLMPGMDGEETAIQIRKLDRDIPIILSSACLTIPERVQKLMTEFVPKGSSPGHLIEVVREHIHSARQQRRERALQSNALVNR
jgi:CheY-like chemotaxis protein